MGYEVTYHYHERQEDGKYNTEETKELKKRVGKAFEELSLEKLAASVMGQLARRDIWVVDVDITEFVKKPLNFKESTDGKGIIIKGKKFSFGASAELVSEGIEEVDVDQNGEDVAPPPQPQSQPAQNVNLAPPRKVVLKHVIFDPPPELIPEAKSRNLAFSPGVRYPVYDAKEQVIGTKDGSPLYGEMLSVRDNNDKEVKVSEKFFIPVQNLVGDFLDGGKPSGGNDPRLSFASELSTVEHQPPQSAAQAYPDIPVDTGQVPEDVMAMPDLGRMR